jgi:para-aminobenzoate synthetase / 4-amino-4-deoxychorismate lyase
VIQARFDDLRPGRRRSFSLEHPIEVLEARSQGEVVAVLARVDELVRAGRWVAGWVTYEAAPAFDPAFEVRPVEGTTLQQLPLAWFAVFSSRGPAGKKTSDGYRLGRWEPKVSAPEHAEAVTEIRDHIRNGLTYQVNHTFRMEADFAGDPIGLYANLTEAQNTAYGAFIDAGRWTVASASPELFFEWRHGKIICKPMKGTTRRGTDLDDDDQRRSWLQASEKNRAENLMIVDMVRNDLGRVAKTGTVKVPALFTTEKYDTVWQLTSTVSAAPRADTRLPDVFAALFPCASITGAPKVATMGIIAELETDPRGVYCGAIGFGGPGTDGEPQWAFNVGIRTVLVDRETGRAWYGTGGGITYDSTPEDEYQEALLKAKVLARESAEFSLLETIRWDPATGFGNLAGHLRRLSESARYFDVPLDPAEVRAALERSTGPHAAPLRVRLLVDRTGWVTVECEPAPAATERQVRLALDTVPVDPEDPFLHHKTTNRRTYEEARARHPESDDVVMIGPADLITETTIANIALLIDGRWLTPPVSSGCLPGVQRAAMLDDGRITESPLTVDDLTRAERIIRLNSLRGVEDCLLTREPPRPT